MNPFNYQHIIQLPDHVKDLIALFAHPIHPCKWEIDYFRHMVYWVEEDDRGWTGNEFQDWVKWREALDRNGHTANRYQRGLQVNTVMLFY